MNRREFLITSSAAAGLLALPRFASAAAGTIDLYSGSDANIVDLWNNTIRPAFEKAHPGVALKVTDAGDNNGLRAIADRALAALKTKIPFIQQLEWGTNSSPEKHDKGFTHIWIATFKNPADRDAYLVHPEHKAFAGGLKDVIDDVFVIDFVPKE